MPNKLKNFKVLNGPAYEVAPKLLGSILVRKINGQTLKAKIVEVEAYDQSDAASHAHGGITKRNQVMYGPCGHLYVYFTYGMHYCCNITTGNEGFGSGCLIRAVEPLEGESVMEGFRGKIGVNLTNGPANLCKALSIDMSLSGHNLTAEPLELIIEPPINKNLITQTSRIGISKAQDKSWRFYITGNKYVSKK